MFFDCLMERINGKSKKRRIPNKTQSFVRNDAVPLGKFTKSTWKILNLAHVRQILDTPQIPLAVTRSFIMNRDGTYRPFKPPPDEALFARGGPSQHSLKPHEFKTVLRVGSPDPQKGNREPTPFIIEWIPDILPQSAIGELRINFEYDHTHNGQLIAFRDTKPSTTVPTVTPIAQYKSNGPPLLAPRPAHHDFLSSGGLISLPINSENLQSTDGITTILTF